MGFSRRKQERKFQSNTGSVAVCSGFDRGLPWRMDVPEKAPGRRFGAVEKEIFWMEQLRKAAMKEQFGPAGLSKEEISSSRRLYEQLKRSMIRRFNIWKGM